MNDRSRNTIPSAKRKEPIKTAVLSESFPAAKPLPELLAPAGSIDSLRAALAAGADAVYFGGTSFSNRMRAKNFGDSELSDAIRLCHSVGAAAHITVNTRVRDREMDDILRFADTLLGDPDTAPDALIVADFGIAREIRRRYPGIALHASTQTSLSSPADCKMLAGMGFTRLVIPRELTRFEIKNLCDAAPIEIEMFLHGAHCVSCSGQCLLSCMMGGRSGNRGECAQPCRLPFEIQRTDTDGAEATKKRSDNRNPAQKSGVLSLADMCLAGRIPEVIDTGVRSLKIEGRLKSAAYVYGTTKIYRTLLDERRCATEEEVRELAKLFSRGFTDGYFSYNYAKMSSAQVSGDAEKAPADRTSEINKALGERIRANTVPETLVPLTAEFTLLEETPAQFTLSCKDIPNCTGTVTGEAPQTASGNPISNASAAKNLTKFGGTKYSLSANDITFRIGENLWYPVSALNDLRRRALAALEECAFPKPEREETQKITEKSADLLTYTPDSFEKSVKKPIRTAEVVDIRTLFEPSVSREFAEYFNTVYVPAYSFGDAVEKSKNQPFSDLAAVLPVYTPSDEALIKVLENLKNTGCRRVLCHTIGQVHLVEKYGFSADISFRANITNTAAYAEYRRIGCDRIVLSPEIPPAAVSSIGGGAVVYGRLPLMTLARCVICDGKCPFGNRGGRTIVSNNYTLSTDSNLTKNPRDTCCTAVLRDRKGEEFPVIGTPIYDCVNVVYNSVPTWMADRSDQIKPIFHQHFMFTTETSNEADRVVRAYIEKRPTERGRRL